MKKLWLFLFVGIFMIGVVNAQAGEVDIFYDADVNINLLGAYNAGDVIDGAISVYNREEFPIVDGYLIVEVLKGCEEPTYPSQFSDCDNIFDDIVIEDINVPGNSGIKVPFSYVLGDDLSSGTYRMDFAFRTEKTPIIGMSHILISSMYQSFELTGTGSFPYASIIRTKTNIDDVTGPIGVGIAPGEDFVLNVYVDSAEARSATLEVSICDWQDNVCDLISSEIKNVNLDVGEQVIPVSLKVPDSPDAYSIRIELKDTTGLVSLYRSRVVALGPMAKVRKLSTDSYYYSGGKMNVNVLVAGSPDHYNNPVVEDISLKVTVTDLVGDSVVGSVTESIGDLDVGNFFADVNLELDVSGRLYRFETCAELTNSNTGELYEEYCYITDASDFPILVHDVELEGSIKEDKYRGSVCVYDGITGDVVSSDLFVSVRQGETIVSQKREVADNCIDLEFSVEGGEYGVFVQDMETNQDFVFSVRGGVFGTSSAPWVYILLAAVLIVVIVSIILFVKRNRRGLPQNG